jgi:predicted GNAT family acetyltransferase
LQASIRDFARRNYEGARLIRWQRRGARNPVRIAILTVRTIETGMPDVVRDNKAQHRFEMGAGSDVAVAYYSLAPGVITLTHTEVPPVLRGQGIASRLTRGVLEAARAQGLKVVPRCSFVAAFMGRHPEFNDLVG